MTGEPLIRITRLRPDLDAVHVTAIITGIEQAVHGSIVAAFLARLAEHHQQGIPPTEPLTPAAKHGRCLARANNAVRHQMCAPLVILR